MQAAIFHGPNDVEVCQVETPQPGANEVLIQVEVGGLCGTDAHLFVGDFDPKFPLIPGHEFAGTVAQVGKGVTSCNPGDRVAIDPSVYCEQCYFCRRNMQNHCESWNALGVTQAGGFAQYVVVPERCIFHIGTLSFVAGAFIEPLACVVYGQQRVRIGIGNNVLIFGAGPIGLLQLQLALHNGASYAVVVDPRAERLPIAHELGAAYTSKATDIERLRNELHTVDPRGFDVVIDATGVPQVVEHAVSFVKNGGKLLVFGVCPNDSEITVNPYEIYRRDLEIIGAFALKKNFQQALDLLQAGVMKVDRLIGKTYNLIDFPQALQLLLDGKAPMKIQIDPQNRQPAFTQ